MNITRSQLASLLMSLCFCFLLVLFSRAGRVAVHASPAIPLPPPPTCSGAACNGTDPYRTHCDQGAVLLQRTDIVDLGYTGGSVDLWWSPTCKTYWTSAYATISPTVGSCPDGKYPTGRDGVIEAGIYSADGTKAGSSADPDGSGDFYGNTTASTPQFSIASPAEAVGSIQTCNGDVYAGFTSGSADNN